MAGELSKDQIRKGLIRPTEKTGLSPRLLHFIMSRNKPRRLAQRTSTQASWMGCSTAICLGIVCGKSGGKWRDSFACFFPSPVFHY